MILAVYKPQDRELPLVLTPVCMGPSLECEQRFGDMHLAGIVALDERLLPVITERASFDDEWLEYVTYGGAAARCVEAVMQPFSIASDFPANQVAEVD